MARGSSYGEALREARLRKGMDLPAVARRLRVRADILAAIEEADFAALPPSGYTRNMINAYARLVGADPREMSSRYLDELHLFETGRSRVNRDRALSGERTSGHESAHPSRTIRSRAASPRRLPAATVPARRPFEEDARRRPAAPSRAYVPPSARDHVRPADRSRERYGNVMVEPSSSSRALPPTDRSYRASSSYRSDSRALLSASRRHAVPPTSAARSYAAPRSPGRETLRAYDSYAFRPDGPRTERGQQPRGRSLPPTEYATSPYAGLYSRRDHNQKATFGDALGTVVSVVARRMPLVIGIVAVIVVLILIVSFIGRGGEPAPDETPTMPISGLTDTSTQNADAYNMSATETAPTSAKFSYEVASGGRSWIELTVDGGEPEVSEVVDGPESKEVEFDESISFSCGNPSPVTIKLDGKVVEPSKQGDEFVYDVTFASILSEWQRAHPTAPGSNAASSGSSASSSSASSNR